MKRSFKWLAAALIVLVAVVVYISATATPPKRSFTVTYRVTGTADYVKAMYTHGQSNRDTAEITSLPWMKVFSGETGDMCLMVLGIGQSGGDVQGEIIVDGETVATCQASGADSTASCAPGVLP